MDPLTQIIGLLRPRGFTWKQVEGGGDWSFRFPANGGVAFCLISAGACRLQLEGVEPSRLAAGDFVLLVAPPTWTLSEGAATESLDFKQVHPGAQHFKARVGQSEAETATRLVGGYFSLGDANSALLTRLMPTMVKVRGGEAGAVRLGGLLSLIDEEAFSDRPGRTLVLERLLEIVMVEVIRHEAGLVGEVRPGLLAGLGDPQVGAALRALHDDVRRDWTVADLAAVAGASRSVFAQRFNRIVGLSPMAYLLEWRMALAKDALRFGGQRPAEVAFASGYGSVSAFSTAFSRTVGCSPAKYARPPEEPPGGRG